MGARVGAVSGGKCIHDEYIRQRRHFSGQIIVIAFFAGVKAHVLAKNDFASFNADPIQPVLFEPHFQTQHAGQFPGHRRQRKFFLVLTLGWPPEMRHQHHLRAGGNRHANGRQGSAETGVAGDIAVADRHVQIFPDQHALTRKIQFAHT